MSLIKAKQLKLANGSLIVGSATGNGTELAKGANNTVLRVNDSGVLEYAVLTGLDLGFTSDGIGIRDLASTTVSEAIDEVASKSVFANRTASSDPVVGDDNTLGYAVGDLWFNAGKIFIAESVATGAAVWTRIDSGADTNIFRFKGNLDASEVPSSLPATPATGDTYKITTGGNFDGDLPVAVKAGDFIAWTGTAWDIIDNTDPVVQGTTDRVTVSETTPGIFVVDIAAGYVGQSSITTLGTVTTGTWEASKIEQAFGGTGITVVTTIADEGKVLTVGATGVLEYAYVSALKDTAGDDAVTVTGTGAAAKLVATNSTVAGDTAKTLTTKDYVDGAISDAAVTFTEETFTVATTEVDFTLANTPKSGSIAVFFNGVRLASATWDIAALVVTLDTVELGYATEAGDTIIISYAY